MPRYSAHFPADLSQDATNFEHAIFVRDRFSIFAAFLTPLWLIFHRMWLELFGFFGIAVVLGFSTFLLGDDATNGIGFLVALLIGFEA